jgi:hypothetical protein
MTDDDVIRLAEWMGLRVDTTHFPEMRIWQSGWRPWDPRTDANADYAVLEKIHAHSTDFGLSQRIMKHLAFPAHQYRVGDNARAALKVIPS